FFPAIIILHFLLYSLPTLRSSDLYTKKIGLNRLSSVVSAFLFAVSPIYFRFTVYWPFFSDVFILLPLLLLSIERFLKNKKIGMFILIVALTFINNFYFAYY